MDAIAPSAQAQQPHEIIRPERQTCRWSSPRRTAAATIPPISWHPPVSTRSTSGARKTASCTKSSAAPRHGRAAACTRSSRAPSSIPTAGPTSSTPAVFRDRLPPYANTSSPRVAAGLRHHRPRRGQRRQHLPPQAHPRGGAGAHPQLLLAVPRGPARPVESTKERFGYCILVDCHSMPSGSRVGRGAGNAAFVLGDCHGTTCAPAVTQTVATC